MTSQPPRGQIGPAPVEAQRISAADARVQVFFGEATETGCRIYAESERRSEAGAPLSGVIRGPFCRYAQTLPTNYPFRAVSGGVAPRDEFRQSDPSANLAEAWVADPCFWTPAMPYLYEYTLEREVAGQRQQIRGQIGIRRLGREGGNLRFDGKRWVLRAARAPELAPGDAAAWHEAALAALVRWTGSVSDGEASQRGVLLVADLRSPVDEEQELRQLRSMAAVGVVILDRDRAPIDPRGTARNLLFAQCFAPGETVRVDDWADLAICELAPSMSSLPAAVGRTVPLVAWRPGPVGLPPQSARALCDMLQRDLAESGINWAGYIV